MKKDAKKFGTTKKENKPIKEENNNNYKNNNSNNKRYDNNHNDDNNSDCGLLKKGIGARFVAAIQFEWKSHLKIAETSDFGEIRWRSNFDDKKYIERETRKALTWTE